ncbi:MAG: NAD(P)/FAD-dependent oxidoreductase [Candidatus Omnitrophota bacterium]|nr:NAD(P)/FAD-dependent oxidoreductase [Candidatus Omnitrophota bacterium]
MKYDTIIIGAGMAGLTCALKLSAAGKKVLVLEKQPVPGGFATGFKRKGFFFESALHCVDALGKGQKVRDFLVETGVAGGLEFIELRDLARIIYPQHDFVAEASRESLLDYFKHSFPQEKNNIDRIFAEFDAFYKHFDRFDDSRLPEWLKLCLTLFLYPRIIKMSCLTCEQVIVKHTHDKKLQAMVSSIWGFMGLPPQRLSAFYFLIIFRAYHYYPNVYVRGGFSRMFEAMANKIRENGSEVMFNTVAKEIVTDGRRCFKAVVTDKAGRIEARSAVSGADCFSTLTGLLDDEAVKEDYRKKMSAFEKSVSAFQVYLGLKVPAKALGMGRFMCFINSSYDHSASFEASLRGDYLNGIISAVDHAQLDPELVPFGKGELLIFTLDNYANWKSLSEQEYKDKKAQVARILIKRVEKYLPGLTDNIEVMETATPMTMARYGSSSEGAIYGLAQTVPQASINRLSQKTKIKGLFLAGAWTRPGGGVHGCFVSGSDAAGLVSKYLK